MAPAPVPLQKMEPLGVYRTRIGRAEADEASKGAQAVADRGHGAKRADPPRESAAAGVRRSRRSRRSPGFSVRSAESARVGVPFLFENQPKKGWFFLVWEKI